MGWLVEKCKKKKKIKNEYNNMLKNQMSSAPENGGLAIAWWNCFEV